MRPTHPLLFLLSKHPLVAVREAPPALLQVGRRGHLLPPSSSHRRPAVHSCVPHAAGYVPRAPLRLLPLLGTVTSSKPAVKLPPAPHTPPPPAPSASAYLAWGELLPASLAASPTPSRSPPLCASRVRCCPTARLSQTARRRSFSVEPSFNAGTPAHPRCCLPCGSAPSSRRTSPPLCRYRRPRHRPARRELRHGAQAAGLPIASASALLRRAAV